MSKIHKLKQTRDINLRFVQNKPSFRETNYITMLLGLSCGKPKTPVTLSHLMRPHALLEHSDTIPRAAEGSPLLDQNLATRAAMKALQSDDLHSLRIWDSYDVTCALTHCPVFCFSSTCQRTSPVLATRWKYLPISSNVITPRQQPCKHDHVSLIHVSPSYVLSHAARHISSVTTSAVSPRQHHVT